MGREGGKERTHGFRASATLGLDIILRGRANLSPNSSLLEQNKDLLLPNVVPNLVP